MFVSIIQVKTKQNILINTTQHSSLYKHISHFYSRVFALTHVNVHNHTKIMFMIHNSFLFHIHT